LFKNYSIRLKRSHIVLKNKKAVSYQDEEVK
jgi:hypothetical protein